MDVSDLSISGISQQKLDDVSQKAQVSVFRKALDNQEDIAKTLIEGAAPPPRTLPDGVGKKLDTVA